MRSLSHLIIAGLAVAFLISPHHKVDATYCHFESSWKNGKTPDAQGRFHATVRYSGGVTAPDANVKQLMEQAVAAWNVNSCASGVVFEEALGSSYADVEFTYTTNETSTGTAGWQPTILPSHPVT